MLTSHQKHIISHYQCEMTCCLYIHKQIDRQARIYVTHLTLFWDILVNSCC